MLLYRLSLRFYPLARALLSLLPPQAQNHLKGRLRSRLAARSAKERPSGLKAGVGRIETPGVNPARARGVNVIGYIKGDFGLGVHARAIIHALETNAVPVGAVDFNLGLPHIQQDEHYSSLIEKDPGYCTNIFCANADPLMLCYNTRNELFRNRYNIHYGAWELAKYPAEWMLAMNTVHELWTLSTFIQQATAACATVPVINMGIAVECALPQLRGREFFGLPAHRFLFLFSYDVSSMTERKNPAAALKAFTRAFPPENHDVGLVVKINFIAMKPDHLEKIREIKEAWAHDSRIIFLDRALTHPDMLNLIDRCDAYISLHRAEGFGLGMAEAMLLKKPVIVTNYSGNTDFTRPYNACLVDYELVPVQPGQYIFEEGQVWAEADTGHAAYHMKTLVENAALYQRLANAGHATISQEFSPAAIGRKMRNRLHLLGLLDGV